MFMINRIMKKYFLLIKWHNKTGLKYLCFHKGTRSNCLKYKGSGYYWLNHLGKHGADISTKILFESDDRKMISVMGIYYSKLWGVVDSKDFANLTVECAQTTAEPLQQKDVREKALRSRKIRLETTGLTEREKISKALVCKLLQSKDIRQKAASSMRNRIKVNGATELELEGRQRNRERLANKQFTSREIAVHKRTSERQKGKTLKERYNNPNFVDKRKGKTAKEIYGDNYRNNSQIDVQLFINGVLRDTCTASEVQSKHKLFVGHARKARTADGFIVKRDRRNLHSFATGDVVTLKVINKV